MNAAFAHKVRVYWEDTDAGGVVFYANYLKFFERARTEWLRRAGFGQQALRERFGLIFVVTESHLLHRAPARLDDELDITVAPAAPPRATLTLAQQALRGAEVLAEGRVTLACVDAASFHARRIPSAVLQAIK
jgi:acyl-CoA thioester hydrolase